ncbi:MAG: AAA family ATPase [Phycisphaerae bacterium]
MSHLLFGIGHRKGFICLTGEVGSGKTTLCRALLNQLGTSAQTALILNPALSPGQLLRAIVSEFGLPTGRADRFDLLKRLNEHLLAINADGGNAVLIIDEAQDLSVPALEMVRLLGNLETEQQKLLQIVLVGQPELRDTLARPSLRQLAQRITVRYHLGTLNAHETEGYLRHRLSKAGAGKDEDTTVRFDRSAVREIYRFSHGTARLINAISDKALLAGYVYQTRTINRDLVRMAAREFREAA